MKQKIRWELLATSALAIGLTLVFALIAFYSLFQKQVIHDLSEDAILVRNLHIFDNI